MQVFQDLYNNFLNFFPTFLHPYISVLLAIFLVYSIFQVLKKNFIFLIALIVLLPAAMPVLKQVLNLIIELFKFLLPG